MPIKDEASANNDYRRLELAILSILAYYNGFYEDSLQDWHKALQAAAPRLCTPERLAKIFAGLSTSGVIQIRKTTGRFSGGEDDAAFFHASAFAVTLTPDGMARWRSIRAA